MDVCTCYVVRQKEDFSRMNYFPVLSVLLIGVIKVIDCNERCSPGSLSDTIVVCCGARLDVQKEPLLYATYSNADSAVGAPVRCTTVTGTVLVPPAPSICCPGPRGRMCCHVPKSRAENKSGAGQWPFKSRDSEFVFVVVVMSALTLVAYCCQAIVERNRREKREGYEEVRDGPSTSRSLDQTVSLNPSYQLSNSI